MCAGRIQGGLPVLRKDADTYAAIANQEAQGVSVAYHIVRKNEMVVNQLAASRPRNLVLLSTFHRQHTLALSLQVVLGNGHTAP